MNTDLLESLTKRFDVLERENFWLKRLGALAIASLGVLILVGTDGFRARKELKAESLVLHDRDGLPRARLEVRLDGAPTLALLGRDGRDQVVLRAGVDGSSSLDYLQGRSPRASLTSLASAGTTLNLYSRSNRSNAKMFMGFDGTAGIVFNRDLRGVGMDIGSDGHSQVRFADKEGRDAGGLGVDSEGHVSLFREPETMRTSSGNIGDHPENVPQPGPDVSRALFPGGKLPPSKPTSNVGRAFSAP